MNEMEPLRQKTYLRTCAPSEDSDQPAHSRSLIRIFTWRILDNQGFKVSSCEQRSDYTDPQANLSLRWAHTSEGMVSHFVTQLIVTQLFLYWLRWQLIQLCPPTQQMWLYDIREIFRSDQSVHNHNLVRISADFIKWTVLTLIGPTDLGLRCLHTVILRLLSCWG